MDCAEGIIWNAEAFESFIKHQAHMETLRARESGEDLNLAA